MTDRVCLAEVGTAGARDPAPAAGLYSAMCLTFPSTQYCPVFIIVLLLFICLFPSVLHSTTLLEEITGGFSIRR